MIKKSKLFMSSMINIDVSSIFIPYWISFPIGKFLEYSYYRIFKNITASLKISSHLKRYHCILKIINARILKNLLNCKFAGYLYAYSKLFSFNRRQNLSALHTQTWVILWLIHFHCILYTLRVENHFSFCYAIEFDHFCNRRTGLHCRYPLQILTYRLCFH